MLFQALFSQLLELCIERVIIFHLFDLYSTVYTYEFSYVYSISFENFCSPLQLDTEENLLLVLVNVSR